MNYQNKVIIIGAGFCGTVTTLNLVKRAINQDIDITLIHDGSPFGKGVAYNPNSNKALLNVPCEKMSCFHDEPNHFLDWTCKQDGFETYTPEFVAKLFLPRALYGKYLLETWNEYISNLPKAITINLIEELAVDISSCENGYAVTLKSGVIVNSANTLSKTERQIEGYLSVISGVQLLISNQQNILRKQNSNLELFLKNLSFIHDSFKTKCNMVNPVLTKSIEELNLSKNKMDIKPISNTSTYEQDYKGYKLQILEEQTASDLLVKRRYGVALNNQGLVVFTTNLTYVKETEIIFSELKQKIDNN
jgi:hypothetical protein